MSINKLLPLAEAAQRYAGDGIQYASGAGLPVGADAIAFGRELVRQGRRNLHALFHCNTQQLNLLAVGQPIHDLGLRDQIGGGDQRARQRHGLGAHPDN